MDQGEFATVFCAKPQNFAWFLGSGTSRTAGLPTATDIIWDLKRRHYCSQENQEITRQDIQNDAVRTRIQSYMDSKGFPQEWADEEYPAYFEKIFGDDKERQRRYLRAILSEDAVTLSIGNRVLGALIASGRCRAVFTTNFDSVVEKSVAEIAGTTLSAYHLEGSHAANQALNNEEYPFYCKLHGDFRYDSLKNLPQDLATQNAALSDSFLNGANRFGFIVTGYSGRDASVMSLFRSALQTGNPFPHGLYWTGIKGSAVHPAVEDLLGKARDKGVRAEYIQIETFDALLLRLWRNIEGKTPEMDGKVRKSRLTSVNIPLTQTGQAKPLIRMNALAVVSMPKQCLELSFRTPKDWNALRQARDRAGGRLIITRSDSILCWGAEERVRNTFGQDLLSIQPHDLPANLGAPGNRHIKGFAEEAICASLARNNPLLFRTTNYSSFLIANPRADARSVLQPLTKLVHQTTGVVPNVLAPPTEHHSNSERVTWAEAVQISIDVRNGQVWLLLNPDIWIWPTRARRYATDFMEKRRSDRYNPKYNDLLDAWIRLILNTEERNAEVILSPFGEGQSFENPSFTIGTARAFHGGSRLDNRHRRTLWVQHHSRTGLSLCG